MASDERTQTMVREAAALMGKLFINRSDVKAIYRADRAGRWHWTAVREKYRMADFIRHLTSGEACLGTYLLTSASRCKFLAFDLDLAKSGKFWPIITGDSMADMWVDLEVREGNLESSLHLDWNHAHAWARLILLEGIRDIRQQIRQQLQVENTLTVITGGGAHVFLPLPELMDAALVRDIGHAILGEIPAARQRSTAFFDYGAMNEVSIEIFPKQDSLDGKDLGNLIRLPFGWHHEAGIRTYAIDPDQEPLPVWRWRKINSMDALRGLAQTVS